MAGKARTAGDSGGVDGVAGAASGVIDRGAGVAVTKPGVAAKTGTGTPAGIAQARRVATTSIMLWGRCTGSLRSIRASRLSIAGESDGSRSFADGGTSVEWATISSPAPSRTNGGRPVASSNKMQPRE
jgi:hypothetical protein